MVVATAEKTKEIIELSEQEIIRIKEEIKHLLPLILSLFDRGQIQPIKSNIAQILKTDKENLRFIKEGIIVSPNHKLLFDIKKEAIYIYKLLEKVEKEVDEWKIKAAINDLKKAEKIAEIEFKETIREEKILGKEPQELTELIAKIIENRNNPQEQIWLIDKLKTYKPEKVCYSLFGLINKEDSGIFASFNNECKKKIMELLLELFLRLDLNIKFLSIKIFSHRIPFIILWTERRRDPLVSYYVDIFARMIASIKWAKNHELQLMNVNALSAVCGAGNNPFIERGLIKLMMATCDNNINKVIASIKELEKRYPYRTDYKNTLFFIDEYR
ncbi:hypothetical protein J4209_05865 [Candidatus Woesearchaeota archaeon]|nr:hypothetical protein [Candidatus Woesearchaeota archaeon]